jgi:hypothetical protein
LAGLSWGIYFFAYNRAKERYQRLLQQTKLSPQLHLLSAAEAGTLVSGSPSPSPSPCQSGHHLALPVLNVALHVHMGHECFMYMKAS